jgi:hypothetical protein
MRKNAQLHLLIESEILDHLRKEASMEEITISDLCRAKLNQNSRLARIESILTEINKKLSNKYHNTNDKTKKYIKSNVSISIAK